MAQFIGLEEATIKKVKRIALTIVFTIPVAIVFAYFTKNVITNDALQIFCFMMIFATAVLIVELIHAKRQKKLNSKDQHKSEDVFK